MKYDQEHWQKKLAWKTALQMRSTGNQWQEIWESKGLTESKRLYKEGSHLHVFKFTSLITKSVLN